MPKAETVNLVVTLTGRDTYRRAGFKLHRGKNLLKAVHPTQRAALEADARLSVVEDDSTAAEATATEPDQTTKTPEAQGPVDGKVLEPSVEEQILGLLPGLDAKDLTKSDGPKISVLEAKLGVEISTEQRDAAWSAYLISQEEQ